MTPHVVSVPRLPGPSATTITSAARTSSAEIIAVHRVTASISPPNAWPHVIQPSSSPAPCKVGTKRENPPGRAAPSVITYATRVLSPPARFAPAATGAIIEWSGQTTTGVPRRPGEPSRIAPCVSSTVPTAVCMGVYRAFMTWPEDPAYYIEPVLAERVRSGREVCYAALGGDRLAAFGFYALHYIEPQHASGVAMSFPPDVAFMTFGLTHPDFRGARLHGLIMAGALKDLATEASRSSPPSSPAPTWPRSKAATASAGSASAT